MALPRKKNLNPSHIKYGMDRVDEIIDFTLDRSDFLPKRILLEDLDMGFNDFVKDDFNLTIDGEVVPVVFMTKEKWADFALTWQMNDEKGNPMMPFLTIKNVGRPELGNTENFRSRIANNKKFEYTRVPTMEDGVQGFDIYKVPQPIPVVVTYELNFFTKYMTSVNRFNEKILEMFASKQYYIMINGYYVPIFLSDIQSIGTMDDFNSHNFYTESVVLKLEGFLLNPDSFEVVRKIRNVNLDIR